MPGILSEGATACLTPGVEDTEKADLRAEVRGVGGDGTKGFGSRAEQDVIDFRLILIRDAGQSPAGR